MVPWRGYIFGAEVKINEKGRGATGSIEIEEEIGLTRLLLRRLLAILLGISDATPYLALVFKSWDFGIFKHYHPGKSPTSIPRGVLQCFQQRQL
jgi:hypothetical protein